MRNYRQLTREQIYQIYALMKAGLFKSQSPESLVSIGYINTLRIIQDCSLIAAIDNLAAVNLQLLDPIKQGVMDRSFLLDSVRHISRHIISQVKNAGKIFFHHQEKPFRCVLISQE